MIPPSIERMLILEKTKNSVEVSIQVSTSSRVYCGLSRRGVPSPDEIVFQNYVAVADENMVSVLIGDLSPNTEYSNVYCIASGKSGSYSELVKVESFTTDTGVVHVELASNSVTEKKVYLDLIQISLKSPSPEPLNIRVYFKNAEQEVTDALSIYEMEIKAYDTSFPKKISLLDNLQKIPRGSQQLKPVSY